MNTVFTRIYGEEALPFNRKEILRYSGARGDFDGSDKLIGECIKEATDRFSYKICYCEFDIKITDGKIDLGFMSISSEKLKNNLNGCEKIILFAATIGTEIDRLIKRYSTLSPAKALIFQAIGAERVEALCDLFCKEIKEDASLRGFDSKPRYSPGYGDLGIEIQKDFFGILDCPRRIGVSLSDSMLMTPSKSVTAIIGLKPSK